MAFTQILAAVVPVFLVVGVGYLVRWLRVITEDAEKSILRLVVNVLYPCFILSKVPGNESLQDGTLVAVAIAVGFGLTLIAMLIAFLTGMASRIKAKDGLNTFCLAAAVQNYGFIPIPLIIALFPDSSDQTLGVLFVHNLGLEIALWTIGIVVLNGKFAGSMRRLVNGPTIAIGVGLFLNFSGLFAWIPDILREATTQLGSCSIPVGLLLVGSALAGVIEHEKWQLNWKIVGSSLLVRFAIMPVVFLLVASLISFSPELRKVLVMESAMPAAIFPIVLAKYYGGRPGVAVQVVLATSLLSLVATPLILMFALDWFEFPI